MTKYTEADFENLSWHDCVIWRITPCIPNSDVNDPTCDLALEIDFIVEWIHTDGNRFKFRVAPATLVFHGVSALHIDIEWDKDHFSVEMHPATIREIKREVIRDQPACLDRPSYDWRICAGWPDAGEIALCAVGFTQTLLAEPVLMDEQSFSLRERNRLING